VAANTNEKKGLDARNGEQMSEEKYTMTGTVKRVEDLQEFAGGFSKREFILTTGDKYPQDIKFTCTKDKTALVAGVSEGDELTVHFNVYGSHWEAKDKYFVDLHAWKIEKTGAASPARDLASHAVPQEGDENLPF